VGKKVFQKIQNCGWKRCFNFICHFGKKNKKLASYLHHSNAKNWLKKYQKVPYMLKKSDFVAPFWIDPPFLAFLTKYEFGSFCWSKYKLITNFWMQKCCQISKICPLDFLPPSWTSDAILNPTRNFSSEC
jgi:hypothetical protein